MGGGLASGVGWESSVCCRPRTPEAPECQSHPGHPARLQAGGPAPSHVGGGRPSRLSSSDDVIGQRFRVGEVPGAALAASRRACDLSGNPVRLVAGGLLGLGPDDGMTVHPVLGAGPWPGSRNAPESLFPLGLLFWWAFCAT